MAVAAQLPLDLVKQIDINSKDPVGAGAQVEHIRCVMTHPAL